MTSVSGICSWNGVEVYGLKNVSRLGRTVEKTYRRSSCSQSRLGALRSFHGMLSTLTLARVSDTIIHTGLMHVIDIMILFVDTGAA